MANELVLENGVWKLREAPAPTSGDGGGFPGGTTLIPNFGEMIVSDGDYSALPLGDEITSDALIPSFSSSEVGLHSLTSTETQAPIDDNQVNTFDITSANYGSSSHPISSATSNHKVLRVNPAGGVRYFNALPNSTFSFSPTQPFAYALWYNSTQSLSSTTVRRDSVKCKHK